MLVQIAQFFLNALVEPYAWLLLARFYLQWLRAPLHNPLGDFIILITHPLVRPMRRMFPAIGRLDTASLLLAFLVELACWSASFLLHGNALNGWLLAWVALRLATGTVYLLIFALLIEGLISWTYPHAPFAPLLRHVTYPFLRPLRRLVPPKGGLDFAFLILFFVCYIIAVLPLVLLEGAVLHAMGAH